MTIYDLTVLTARRLILIDKALHDGNLKPVDWSNERIRLFQALLVYYDQSEGPAELIMCNANRTLLRYQLYKEDIPQKAIDRAITNLNKENPPFDVRCILTCEETGKEAERYDINN